MNAVAFPEFFLTGSVDAVDRIKEVLTVKLYSIPSPFALSSYPGSALLMLQQLAKKKAERRFSGIMTDTAVQEVKDAADILDIIGERVSLSKSGVNYKGLCPFHNEKTPSFTVNPSRQSYYCFGCGEGGDVFSFLMKYENLSFPETLQELARRYNVHLPDRTKNPAEEAQAKKRLALQTINWEAASCYHRFLLRDPKAAGARSYLQNRGMPQEVIEEFQLGYAPDSWDFIGRQLAGHPPQLLREAGLVIPRKNEGHYDRFRNRILFPIFDINGKVIGFGGRIIGEGQPKYLNTDRTPLFDKGRSLFGLYQNREAIRRGKKCLVVEGNFDLLSLVAHGIRNVVAPLGTALTAQHVRKLKGYAEEVIMLFDGDQAGLKAALRAVPLFLDEMMTAKVAVLPAKHDPDSFLREQGAEGLLSHIEKARPLPEFCFDQLVQKHGLSVEGKARIVQELGTLIAALDDRNLQRTLFVSHFSERLNIEAAKLAQAARSREKPAPKAASGPAHAANLPLKHRLLLEYLLCFPSSLQAFQEAGIEELVTEGVGKILLDLLTVAVEEQSAAVGPERILSMADAEMKPLVARLLESAPRYDEEQREAVGTSMLNTLRSSRLQKKRHQLLQEIEQAQKNHETEELLTSLLQELQALDREQSTEKSFNC